MRVQSRFSRLRGRWFGPDLGECGDCASHVRDDYGPANDEADGQTLEHLLIGHSFLRTAHEVVSHAVIAAQYK